MANVCGFRDEEECQDEEDATREVDTQRDEIDAKLERSLMDIDGPLFYNNRHGLDTTATTVEADSTQDQPTSMVSTVATVAIYLGHAALKRTGFW